MGIDLLRLKGFDLFPFSLWFNLAEGWLNMKYFGNVRNKWRSFFCSIYISEFKMRCLCFIFFTAIACIIKSRRTILTSGWSKLSPNFFRETLNRHIQGHTFFKLFIWFNYSFFVSVQPQKHQSHSVLTIPKDMVQGVSGKWMHFTCTAS